MRIDSLAADRAELAPYLELPRRVATPPPHLETNDATLAELVRWPADLQRILLATTDDGPVARCVARLAPELRDDAGRPLGCVGQLAAADDGESGAAVLGAAVGWLREQGAGQIVGPFLGDTWHSYRVNLGPYDEAPFLMEPWNPPSAPAVWEAAGFVADCDYSSVRVERLREVTAVLAERAARATAAGYRLEAVAPRQLDTALDRIYRLVLGSFGDNYLYSPIGRDAFLALYAGARHLLAPGLAWIAVAPDGRDAGFVFAYPDRLRAVAALRSSRSRLLGILRFLWHRGDATVVDIKTLGVLPEHRRSGVAAALMHRVYERTLAAGNRAANLCLIREGNPSQRLDGGLGRVFRRYRLYRHAGPEE